MLEELKILHAHGVQYVKDLRNARLSPLFRGRPTISTTYSEEDVARLTTLCPTSAITGGPLAIDLGKCVFCRACEQHYPQIVQFTNDYRLAANKREDLVVKAGDEAGIRLNAENIRAEVRSVLKRSLKLRQVSAGGDASCEMELNAAGNVNFDMGRFGIEFVASPRHADGIVITGPIAKNMARALELCYEAVPEPKIVVLVGSDAISGGLFQGSPALDRSFIDSHHVDLYIPGNPAHPLTFINGLMDLLGIEEETPNRGI
jgi:Ni,Fe-hydrogenase III small subunit/ferredoxin